MSASASTATRTLTLISAYTFFIGVEECLEDFLEAVLENIIDEAVPSPKSEVQEPIVPFRPFCIMHPPHGTDHVLSPVINEGLDLLPSLSLSQSLPALSLFLVGLILPLQALQHVPELSLREVHSIHPASLDPVDVLVGVTVEVLELFDRRAGGFVLDHASSIGSGCGQGNSS